tara:strand:- start:14068 stop:14193 length:126 start_codon:yes stop_codon:yes gene_type:complete
MIVLKKQKNIELWLAILNIFFLFSAMNKGIDSKLRKKNSKK